MKSPLKPPGLRPILAAGAAVLSLGAAAIMPAPAHAQFGFGGIVYDPTNYAQNVLTAARSLQQINNQITSLQNEAQMLINQARNLASLPYSSLQQIQQSVQRTQQLLSQAQNIAFDVQNVDQMFQQKYGKVSLSATDAQLVAATCGSAIIVARRHASAHKRVAALSSGLRDAGVVVIGMALGVVLMLGINMFGAGNGYRQVPTSQVVAVLDSGVDYTRAEFGACAAPGSSSSRSACPCIEATDIHP